METHEGPPMEGFLVFDFEPSDQEEEVYRTRRLGPSRGQEQHVRKTTEMFLYHDEMQMLRAV